MPLFRPSELLHFLESIGAKPKRTLSQNFLVDGNVVKKIVGAALNSSKPLIVEIGPGPGVLTEAFLEKGLKVIAVEKDEKLASALYRLDPIKKQLEVHCKDILACSLPDLLTPADEIVIVSNLPYHLTRSIIEWLSCHHDLFSRAVIMVQHEVARKLMPDYKPSSYMQVVLSFFFDLAYLCRVRKSCFFPSPKVDSSVLVLHSREPLIRDKERQEKFLAFVARAFSHRRKTLCHSLSDRIPKEEVKKALKNIGHNIRPEQMDCSQWVDLFCALEDLSGGCCPHTTA